MVDFVKGFGVVQIYYINFIIFVEAVVDMFYMTKQLREAAMFLPKTMLSITN